MQWEQLTAPQFDRAVRQTGRVCLLAVGCLEKHADHLPLGTDTLNGHRICCLAAEAEPAIVFPPYYFGQIHEARCFPGTIATGAALTLELLQAVCDEIARNGLRKIILYNAHGGNTALLQYLLQCTLERRRDYALYLPARLNDERRKQWAAILETPVHGHACECETSISLANHPDLVDMDAIGGRRTERLGRLAHLGPVQAQGYWYADYPDHYAGDANPASAAKGEKLRGLIVDQLAETIAAVKADQTTGDLLDEFYGRCDEIGR